MGIEALYVKPRLSLAHPAHVKYPYLLRGLEITRAKHVWAADICYIPVAKGFYYLVAIMDWASRIGSLMETLQHTEQLILHRCSGRGDRQVRLPQDLQYRPGQPVHRGDILPILSVHEVFQSAWTARAIGWITSLSSGSGTASSTRTFT
jgi:hypothetical protein